MHFYVLFELNKHSQSPPYMSRDSQMALASTGETSIHQNKFNFEPM